jgi:DNA-binding transcriptional MerR regulator
MNEKHKKMTIGELADAAGVTVRTIRYYINEGILPTPELQGRYTLYEPWYLDYLELIRRWKDAYLPLKEIRARIRALSNEDVRNILSIDLLPQEAVVESINQITQELSGDLSDQPEKEEDEQDALAYIQRLRGTSPQAVNETVSDYIKRARRESRRPAAPAPQPKTPAPRPSSRGTEWRRIEVFPGFELHLTEDLSRRYWRELEELIDWVLQHISPKHY